MRASIFSCSGFFFVPSLVSFSSFGSRFLCTRFVFVGWLDCQPIVRTHTHTNTITFICLCFWCGCSLLPLFTSDLNISFDMFCATVRLPMCARDASWWETFGFQRRMWSNHQRASVSCVVRLPNNTERTSERMEERKKYCCKETTGNHLMCLYV